MWRAGTGRPESMTKQSNTNTTDEQGRTQREGTLRRTFLKGTGALASSAAVVGTVNAAENAAATVKERTPAVPNPKNAISETPAQQAQPSVQCGTASITFEDQVSGGTTVVIESVTLSAGGFVDIHDTSLNEGNRIESVIGVSAFLAPGTHENVKITLFNVPGATNEQAALEESQTLIAMAHHDTDGDLIYDFVALRGAQDRPYLNEDGDPVTDSATITLGEAPPPEEEPEPPAEEPGPDTLRIEGVGFRVAYAFRVSGTIEEGRGLSSEDRIAADRKSATGAVRSGREVYTFTGDLQSFIISNDARVLLNNEVFDFDAFAQILTIVGSGSRADYRFGVTGTTLEARRGLSSEDSIEGQVATGAVRSGRDSYRFTGRIAFFELDGEATVTVNGIEVRPQRFLPNTLTIVGSGTRAGYQFTTSGGLGARTRLTVEDRIEDRTAIGAVRAGLDSYGFSGDITAFELTGDATVLLNGREVEPTQLGG